MSYNRFDDAPHLAYHDFLAERAQWPFAWGTNDCATFAADGLLAMSGNDALGPLRGTYRTARGAWKAAKSATGTSDLLGAVTILAAKAGLQKRVNPLAAMRGDLVLVEQADGKLICGLVGLSGRWVHSPGHRSLQNLCITAVRHAWTH